MVTAKFTKSNVLQMVAPVPNRYDALNAWLTGSLADTLYEQEYFEFQEILPKLFGDYLLAVGEPRTINQVVQHSLPQNKIYLSSGSVLLKNHESWLIANEEKLPIVTDGVDVIYLGHCLEFSPDPHGVLREANRVLLPQGHIVISGFNPLSLWGIWKYIVNTIKRDARKSEFISIFRIKDWLSLLGFEVKLVHTFFFRPPIVHKKIMRRLYWLERYGRKLWPLWGGAYIIVAQKKLIPLTPVKVERNRAQRNVVMEPLIEPAISSKG